MARFGAMVLVYRQIDYIDYCLRAAVDHFDAVACMYTDVPFKKYNPDAPQQFGGDDGSRDVVVRHATQHPHVHVVSSHWESEEAMRTDALSLLKDLDIDFTYVLDADEIYPDGALETIKTWIASHEPHSRFRCRYRNLFKRMDREINADDLWHNVCYRTRDIASFERGRTITIPDVKLPDELFFWHFGWVLSDERIYEKVNTYSHAHELPPDWFRRKWLEWTPATTDLCARNKWKWRGTSYVNPSELPAVLRSHPRYPRA